MKGIRTISREELAGMLREYEDAWEASEGERITSAEFYDRYTDGAVDSMFAMAWATYYEIHRRLTEQS